MPATPTFTIVDNADGTATVTIAGSTALSTNSVLVQNVDDQWGLATSWVTAGSRTGDGTVVVTLAVGFYWFAISSVLTGQTAVTVPKYAGVRASRLIVFPAILEAAQSRVRLLNIVDSARVFTHTVVDESKVREVDKACVILGPADDNNVLYRDQYDSMQRDDIGYAVVAAYCAPAGGNSPERQSERSRERWYGASQDIRRAFIAQSLDVGGGGNVLYCDVKPLRPAEKQWWEKFVFCAAYVLMFRSRENRGLGA